MRRRTASESAGPEILKRTGIHSGRPAGKGAHPHERVAAKFFVREPTLEQPEDLKKARIEVHLFRLAKRVCPTQQQKLRDRVARQGRDVVALSGHGLTYPLIIPNGRS
jgi:hypothetical protein